MWRNIVMNGCVVMAGSLVADGSRGNDHVADVETFTNDSRTATADELSCSEGNNRLEDRHRGRGANGGVEHRDFGAVSFHHVHVVRAVFEGNRINGS